MIKIVWDWNGTLLDDVQLCLSCINHTLASEGLKPLDSLEQYRSIFGFPIQDYYVRAGFDFEKTSWPVVANRYMDDYMSRWTCCSLAPDALEALDFAKKHGWDNIILSASKLDNLKAQVSHYPLEERIDALYGISDIYAHSKLELAREFLSTCLPQDEIWCIGDTLHDAEIAADMQANCVLVAKGHQSAERLKEAGVPVVHSLREAVQKVYERSSH